MNAIRRTLLLISVLLVAGSAYARHPMSTVQTGWHTAGNNQGDLVQVSAYGIEQTGQVIEFWARMRIAGRWNVSRAAVACSDQRYMIIAFMDDSGEPVMMDGEDLPIASGSNVELLALAVCGQHGQSLGGPAPVDYSVPSHLREPVKPHPGSVVVVDRSPTKPAALRQRDPDCATGKRAIWSPACQ